MERATQALMQTDLSLAEQLMADHDQAMSARRRSRVRAALAQQAPVAGDLRAIVSSLQISPTLDRMGALA